jgi:tetratricopeptide (TPR) repeat protein
MTNKTEKGQDNAGYNAITPAEIVLTHPHRAVAGDNLQISVGANRRWLWPTLFALIILAAAVIFVLPQYVQTPVIAPTAGTEPAAVTTAGATAAALVEAAPWQTAQLARQRGKSQELLSQMLERQEQLEQKNVKAWAGSEYDRILQLAIDGDAAYRQHNFDGSADLYTDALNGMSALLENMETLFGQTMNEGNVALAQGDAVKAVSSFTQALLMKPDAEPALSGMQRARTLDQVLQLITDGNDLQQNGNLEQAKVQYEQALAIDKLADLARQQLAVVNTRIRDGEFNRMMSAGYAHLQNGELAKAKASFEQANRLKSGTSEASSALAQIHSRITNDQINTLLQTATAM